MAVTQQVIEKKALVAALEEVAGLSVLRGAKYANSSQKKLPAVSVDYLDAEIVPLTEDGSWKSVTCSHIIVLYVKIEKDEEDQEDLFDTWLDAVTAKLQDTFPKLSMVMQKVGDANYANGTAYSAAFLVSLGTTSMSIT